MYRQTKSSTDFELKLERTVRSLIKNHGLTYEALNRGDESVLAFVIQRVQSFNMSKFVVALASSCNTHMQIAVLEAALRNGNADLGVALEQLAVEAIMMHLHRVLELVPSYEHDCPNCAFLGHMLRQSSPSIGEAEEASLFVDLYVCSKHVAGPGANDGLEVIARFSANAFSLSRSPAGSGGSEPHLNEAARRAAKYLGAI